MVPLYDLHPLPTSMRWDSVWDQPRFNVGGPIRSGGKKWSPKKQLFSPVRDGEYTVRLPPPVLLKVGEYTFLLPFRGC